MKTSILSIAIILASLFVLGGCASKNEAEKVATEFHEQLKEQNYTALNAMISDEALSISPAEDWIALFKSMESLGKLKKVTKNMGFNTQIKNGTTTVELKYTLEFEKGSVNEEIIFIKTNGPFKLYGYNFRQQ
jgi:hypothetical protein